MHNYDSTYACCRSMEASKQYHGSMQAAELWNHASSRTMVACEQQNHGSIQAAELSMQAAEPWKHASSRSRTAVTWRVVRSSSAIRPAQLSRLSNGQWSRELVRAVRSGPYLSLYRVYRTRPNFSPFRSVAFLRCEKFGLGTRLVWPVPVDLYGSCNYLASAEWWSYTSLPFFEGSRQKYVFSVIHTLWRYSS